MLPGLPSALQTIEMPKKITLVITATRLRSFGTRGKTATTSGCHDSPGGRVLLTDSVGGTTLEVSCD